MIKMITRRHDFYLYEKELKNNIKNQEILYFTPKRLGNTRIVGNIESHKPYDHYEFRESIPEFQHYGHDFVLKRYAGIDRLVNTQVSAEHGCYLMEDTSTLKSYAQMKRALTMSDFRKDFLIRNGVNAFSIGPYIYYGRLPIDKKNYNELKKCFGKTLVYFPQHSCETDSCISDHLGCANELARLAKILDVETIIICYYWYDLLNYNIRDYYKHIPHVPACCGHRSNPFFLDNLKLILALSDFSCGNDIGTITGYSVFMHKPYIVLDIETSFSSTSSTIQSTIKTSLKREFLLNNEKSLFEITPTQREMCSIYWGFSNVKSPEEIRYLLC